MEELDTLQHTPEAIMTDGRLRRAQLRMLAMLKEVDAICNKHSIDYWLDAGTLLGAIRHQGFIPWDDDMDIAMPRASYHKFLTVAAQELPSHMYLQKAGEETGYYNLGTPLKIRDQQSYYLEKYESGEEEYKQSVFIDVFVYDKMWEKSLIHSSCKRIARKLLRILGTKHSKLPMGRSHGLYRAIGFLIPKFCLHWGMSFLISQSNRRNSRYIGRGYDCKKVTKIEYNDVFPLKKGVFEGYSFNIPHQAENILSKEYGHYMQLPPESERTLRHCKALII